MNVQIITEDGTMVQIQDERGVLTVPRADFDRAEQIYLKTVRNTFLWAISCFASLIFCECLRLPHWTLILNASIGSLYLLLGMWGWRNSRKITARAFVTLYHQLNGPKGEPDAEV